MLDALFFAELGAFLKEVGQVPEVLDQNRDCLLV